MDYKKIILIIIYGLFFNNVFAVDIFEERFTDSILLHDSKYYNFEKHLNKYNFKNLKVQKYLASIWHLIDTNKLSNSFKKKLRLSNYSINSYVDIYRYQRDDRNIINFLKMQGDLRNNPIFKYNKILEIEKKNNMDSVFFSDLENYSKMENANETFLLNNLLSYKTILNRYFVNFMPNKIIYNRIRLIYYYRLNDDILLQIIPDYIDKKYNNIFNLIIKECIKDKKSISYIEKIMNSYKNFSFNKETEYRYRLYKKDLDWMNDNYKNLSNIQKERFFAKLINEIPLGDRDFYRKDFSIKKNSAKIQKILFPFYIKNIDSTDYFLKTVRENRDYYYYWLSLLELTDSVPTYIYTKEFLRNYKGSFWINDYLLWKNVIEQYQEKIKLRKIFICYLKYDKSGFMKNFNILSNVSIEYKILLSFLKKRFSDEKNDISEFNLWYESLKNTSNGKFLAIMVEEFFPKDSLLKEYRNILKYEKDSTWKIFVGNRILEYNN